jgi:trans-L-3-hydroxyproline dehydratase
MLAKRQYVRAHCDALRRQIMLEPRGHADMYGCLLTPPVTADGDVGVLFMHNEGFSTMCGHGIIGLTTVGLETGLVTPRAPRTGDTQVLNIDSPAGRVVATAHWQDGRVAEVSFVNVPSFVLERDLVLAVPGVGSITCDIAFGGAFYAYVDAAALGVQVVPEAYARLIDLGMRVKRQVMESYTIVHPSGDADLEFLYGTIIVERLAGAARGGPHSRNVCVFADGEVDRSPTGTGVAGRAAIHHARGDLPLGQWITIHSVIGTAFDVRALERTRVGPHDAIIPEVRGSAAIVGLNELLVDPVDRVGDGFLLR